MKSGFLSEENKEVPQKSMVFIWNENLHSREFE